MINKTFAALPLSLAAALFLAACGGDSDSDSSGVTAAANAPSKFRSTDDVAVLVDGIGNTVGDIDFGLGSPKPSVKARAKGGALHKSSLPPKATETEACDSGSVSYTDDTTTAFDSDGTVVFNDCRDTSSSGSFTFSSTSNGKASSKCTDAAQTADVCNADTSRLADGANGSTTLDFAFSSKDSSTSGNDSDTELKLKADVTSATSGSSETTRISGSLLFNDKIERVSGSAVFENLTSVFTTTGTGSSETINGAFGFATSTSKCAIGKVTIKTDSPLITDSSFTTTAGRVSVTDGSGQTATVQFNADGSYTVTLPNGATKTYDDSFDSDVFCR